MSSKHGPHDTEPPDELLDTLLSLPESSQLEFKRASADNTSKLKTVVALLNTEGGFLVIGIEDPDKAVGRERVFGVQENEASVDELRRMIRQRITPPLTGAELPEAVFRDVPCQLRSGARGSIVVVEVPKSPAVHSIVDGGTYARLEKSNRQLSAAEITELSMTRGVQPWVNGTTDAPFELLETPWWREYAGKRRLSRRIDEALFHLGLARRERNGELRPLRAAVLLFAEEPSGLLDSKASIRVMHFAGDGVERSPHTNLVRPPTTVRGPLLEQIRGARSAIVDALAAGIQKTDLGFEIIQKYPLRVLEEAITNAVLHRDYRVPEDIHVRVFENRIEIESPGRLPSSVTLSNIGTIGSRPRNRVLVAHLRDFPTPPNLDAGEGVPMMMETMSRANLYPPTLVAPPDWPKESVLLSCFNQAKPSAWDQIDAFLTEHSDIGNAEVRRLLRLDTLRASQHLRAWVQLRLLVVSNPDAAKQHRRYRRPGGVPSMSLFSGGR